MVLSRVSGTSGELKPVVAARIPLAFARSLERRYLALGGKIRYESRVNRILVENDRAMGVELVDGSEHGSDSVISAADGRTTIFDMLDGRYVSKEIQGYYDTLPVSRPVIYVALGVADTFDEMPHQTTGLDFPLEVPVKIGERDRERMCVQIYNFDPTLAPAGKTFMRVYFATDYAYWKEVGQVPGHYQTEKEEITESVMASLDKRFPGLATKVEMWDVSTPLTFERYTGNWQGTSLGWRITTKTLRLRMGKTLPRLKNFYMAGQWLESGGGAPTAALSGRDVIQLIRRSERKPFAVLDV